MLIGVTGDTHNNIKNITKICEIFNAVNPSFILHTGDIAYKDRQNYYYIVGRKNKFIKLYGIRFNLEDIDKSLKKNGINAKCISKNDKLFVISSDKSNEMKIKKIINQNFKIRNNEISISNKFLRENKTNFKFL